MYGLYQRIYVTVQDQNIPEIPKQKNQNVTVRNPQQSKGESRLREAARCPGRVYFPHFILDEAS